VRDELDLEAPLPERNGAQRARSRFERGDAIADIYRDAVAETRRTYVPEGVLG
jgi:hypothetical protein